MSIQTPENPQFYLSAPTPCPYLEGKEEQKVFTHLSGNRSQNLHQHLAHNGFRRSQNLIYRPHCQECHACKSARVCVEKFAPTKSQRRILNTNKDISRTVLTPRATDEHYDLFLKYLEARHKHGGMAEMNDEEFQDMIEDTPVASSLVEYRLHACQTPDGATNSNSPLLAVALIDNMADGFSMVYSFFDPQMGRRSLGNYMILDHITRAIEESYNYLYLGYWVKDSPKMHYKSTFRPIEIHSEQFGWNPLE